MAKRFAERWSDERDARRAFPAVRKFVDRFGEFVSTSSGVTLHAIAQTDIRAQDPGPLMKLGMLSLDIFQSVWSTVNERLKTEKATAEKLRLSLSEFAIPISLYNNHCMRPVFERLPQEVRSQATGLPKHVEDQVDWERIGRSPPDQISEDVKRSLQAFRDRFNAFLDDYEDFCEGGLSI